MLIIFDRKKDYACLTAFPNFIYWILKDYFDNWLAPPPGVTFKAWLNFLAETLGNYLDIRVESRAFFASAALWLWEKRLNCSTLVYPTLWEVRDFIKGMNIHIMSNLSRRKETVTNMLDGILISFGDNICSQRKLDWNNLVTCNWGISLDSVATEYQNLFIAVNIGKIVGYFKAYNLRGTGLSLVFVFDEASTMFKKWQEAGEKNYLLTDYMAQCREFGIGFIIGTQTLSNLADSVLANTGCKILVGGAGIGSDYDLFASATGMTREQKEFLKRRTLPGMACMKDFRYSYPFVLEVPKIA
jgi:hypothetical protein